MNGSHLFSMSFPAIRNRLYSKFLVSPKIHSIRTAKLIVDFRFYVKMWRFPFLPWNRTKPPTITLSTLRQFICFLYSSDAHGERLADECKSKCRMKCGNNRAGLVCSTLSGPKRQKLRSNLPTLPTFRHGLRIVTSPLSALSSGCDQ